MERSTNTNLAWVRRKMVTAGVTQYALAARLGVKQPTVSLVLSGRAYCSPERARRIAAAVDELAEPAPTTPPPSKHRHDTASRRASQAALLEERRKSGEHGPPAIRSLR